MDACENLIGEDAELKVKLEMLRGLSDKFYYALRDDGAASDTLAVLKFYFEYEEGNMSKKKLKFD